MLSIRVDGDNAHGKYYGEFIPCHSYIYLVLLSMTCTITNIIDFFFPSAHSYSRSPIPTVVPAVSAQSLPTRKPGSQPTRTLGSLMYIFGS